MEKEANDRNDLLRCIARSEGLNNVENIKNNYVPILKHPLPVSDHRHLHEKVLRKVLSCKPETQAIAAITLGDAWTLEEIYMRFGDIVLGDKNGSSVVHLAVQMNNIECLMVLINIGVDLNKKNNLGFTPLYIANAAGQTTIEELLIANKAKMENNDDIEEVMYTGTVLDVHPEPYQTLYGKKL